jgi:hypothetical protein
MTPDQINLMLQAARTLLAHQAAGRKCDPNAIQWAKNLLAANPTQKVNS